MKLIYAAVFALFPLAAPAQTLDSFLPSALCAYDHYEDTAGQCSPGKVLSFEAFLEEYSAVGTRDTGDDLTEFFSSEPDDAPVDASLGSQIGTASAKQVILTLPNDDCHDAELAGEWGAIASETTAPEPQLETVAAHDEDDVAITGPAANRIPVVASAASAQDDNATSE